MAGKALLGRPIGSQSVGAEGHRDTRFGVLDGCQECHGSGYAGRTAILEIIPITPKVSDMLSKGEITPYELELKIQEEGKLPNLRNNGLKLLKEGKTDIAAIGKMIDMSTDE